ncbi:MAG: hypothetical protein LBO08_01830 [Rickettsiales bacterium]|nr:hypothetical protein [Rickettsiales bacterium]
MKKLFYIFCLLSLISPAADAAFNCGDGHVLKKSAKNLDGIETYECERLWCRDLENGKYMGLENRVITGYRDTAAPSELCDANGKCISCFGDRKWCAGQSRGVFNPEYGAYTRGGADNNAYASKMSGDCFVWDRLMPECAPNQVAIMQNDSWLCASSTGGGENSRAPSVRRTAVAPTRTMKMKH